LQFLHTLVTHGLVLRFLCYLVGSSVLTTRRFGSADILLRFFPTAHTLCTVVYIATRTHVWTFLAPIWFTVAVRLRLPHTFTLVGLRVVVRTIRAVTRLRLDARVTPCVIYILRGPFGWVTVLAVIVLLTTGCCLPHVAPRCCVWFVYGWFVAFTALRLVGWITHAHTRRIATPVTLPFALVRLRSALLLVYALFTLHFGYGLRLVGLHVCTHIRRLVAHGYAHTFTFATVCHVHIYHTHWFTVGLFALYVTFVTRAPALHLVTHTHAHVHVGLRFTVYVAHHVCWLRSRFCTVVVLYVGLVTTVHTRLRLVTPSYTPLLYTRCYTHLPVVVLILVYGCYVCYTHGLPCLWTVGWRWLLPTHGWFCGSHLRTRRFTVYRLVHTRVAFTGCTFTLTPGYTLHTVLRFFTFGSVSGSVAHGWLHTRFTHTHHTHLRTRVAFAHTFWFTVLYVRAVLCGTVISRHTRCAFCLHTVATRFTFCWLRLRVTHRLLLVVNTFTRFAHTHATPHLVLRLRYAPVG